MYGFIDTLLYKNEFLKSVYSPCRVVKKLQQIIQYCYVIVS